MSWLQIEPTGVQLISDPSRSSTAGHPRTAKATHSVMSASSEEVRLVVVASSISMVEVVVPVELVVAVVVVSISMLEVVVLVELVVEVVVLVDVEVELGKVAAVSVVVLVDVRPVVGRTVVGAGVGAPEVVTEVVGSDAVGSIVVGSGVAEEKVVGLGDAVGP